MIEKQIEKKLKEFVQSDEFKQTCSEMFQELLSNNKEQYESVIVESEEKIIEYSNKRYDCQEIGEGKWLMKK